MLENFCLAIAEDGWGKDRKEEELFTVEVKERFSLPSLVGCCVLSGDSKGCSEEVEVDGVGTKNLWFTVGLIVGVGGDWNKLVGFPPPAWLKVSTYLPTKKPYTNNLHIIRNL